MGAAGQAEHEPEADPRAEPAPRSPLLSGRDLTIAGLRAGVLAVLGNVAQVVAAQELNLHNALFILLLGLSLGAATLVERVALSRPRIPPALGGLVAWIVAALGFAAAISQAEYAAALAMSGDPQQALVSALDVLGSQSLLRGLGCAAPLAFHVEGVLAKRSDRNRIRNAVVGTILVGWTLALIDLGAAVHHLPSGILSLLGWGIVFFGLLAALMLFICAIPEKVLEKLDARAAD